MRRLCLLAFVLTLIFASCGQSYEKKQRLSREERARLAKIDSLALKVAVMPTLDCLPIYIAKDENLFDNEKVDVSLKIFNAQMDCDTAIVGYTANGVVSDLVRTVRIIRKGTPLVYLSSTNGAWQLISNRTARVKELSQLGDKMVAMTRYSATDFLTDKALDGVKTKAKVFRIQVNDVRVRLDMLLNNEMDAEWLMEPQATMARMRHNPVIADSKKMGYNLGVIAFREDCYADRRRREQIRSFSRAYNMACDSINKNGVRHYEEVLKKYYHLDDKTIKALPSLRYSHIAKPAAKDVEAARKWN